MENWATDPEFLKMYARHYKTGEPIPDELIEKIRKSSTFNQGFATTEYLAASLPRHGLAHPGGAAGARRERVRERASLGRIGLIPEIVSRYRSTYFAHIFGDGGYAAGYYSYIWAEVLDADAFQAFKETSLFDQKTAPRTGNTSSRRAGARMRWRSTRNSGAGSRRSSRSSSVAGSTERTASAWPAPRPARRLFTRRYFP